MYYVTVEAGIKKELSEILNNSKKKNYTKSKTHLRGLWSTWNEIIFPTLF